MHVVTLIAFWVTIVRDVEGLRKVVSIKLKCCMETITVICVMKQTP